MHLKHIRKTGEGTGGTEEECYVHPDGPDGNTSSNILNIWGMSIHKLFEVVIFLIF